MTWKKMVDDLGESGTYRGLTPDGPFTLIVRQPDGSYRDKETTMLSWSEAVASMNAEGFGYVIGRMYAKKVTLDHAYAWEYKDDYGHILPANQVRTTSSDPTKAINDLLHQCRVRWPKPDPWDAMTLDDLEAECARRRWDSWAIGPYSGDIRYSARWGFYPDGMNQGRGDTMADALRDAMKNRRSHEEKQRP